MESTTDEELLARHRDGEAGAFGHLYDRHGPGLYAFALGLAQEAGAAEDLVQESFLRLISFRQGAVRVRPFLYTVALNLARDERRKSAVRRRARPPVRPDAGASEEWALLDDLRRLPADLREVLLMKALGGFTFAEIGEILGIPLSTAATRHQAAVGMLERLWRAE